MHNLEFTEFTEDGILYHQCVKLKPPNIIHWCLWLSCSFRNVICCLSQYAPFGVGPLSLAGVLSNTGVMGDFSFCWKNTQTLVVEKTDNMNVISLDNRSCSIWKHVLLSLISSDLMQWHSYTFQVWLELVHPKMKICWKCIHSQSHPRCRLVCFFMETDLTH